MRLLFRLAFALASAALFFAMLGPFQGAERGVGLTDGAAHVIGFAIITATAFLNLPKATRIEVLGGVLLLGLAVELIQGVTGRQASLHDLAADAIGAVVICLAWRGRAWW